MSVNINKDTMVKVRTDVTHKCVGNENSKTNLFELQQQKALKIVYLENQQRQCFNLSCGNGGGGGGGGGWAGNQMLLKLGKKKS